jgi:enamine deaminase RidA (YjgF/YER057c/UK114 family)
VVGDLLFRAAEGGGPMTRRNISSGVPWEETVGYSRAVRVGSLIEVAGTTAVDERGEVVGPGDPYAQARYALTKIGHALSEAGAGFENVIRTRVFVTDISRWEEVGRAHGEVFRDIRPASTLVAVASLVRSDLLVEIEATAVAPEDSL